MKPYTLIRHTTVWDISNDTVDEMSDDIAHVLWRAGLRFTEEVHEEGPTEKISSGSSNASNQLDLPFATNLEQVTPQKLKKLRAPAR